jgi:hypothetical protein
MPRLRRFFSVSADPRPRVSMRHAFDTTLCVEKARLATVTVLFPRAADFVRTL